VASKNLNRKSIGIEINPKYCEISVRRLRQEVFDFRKVD
jgi:DNA modification methylase